MKAIFFDAAGTLISVREPVGVTYARIANSHGISVSSDVVARAFRSAWKTLPPPQHHGVPAPDDERAWWRELVRRCFATALGAELPPEKLDPLFNELYSHYARHDAWTVFPDVVPALSLLRERHRLFVLSNFDKRLRRILEGHGLTAFFESLIISSEVGASKPHALIFTAAVEAAGLPPRECIHIGDDEILDLEGARAAGFDAFLVRRPGSGLDAIAGEVMARSVL
jgi:putative hydrolase of the HAD superfamily